MTIKTKPATDEYRDNWDRIFGGKLIEQLRDNADLDAAEHVPYEDAECKVRARETAMIFVFGSNEAGRHGKGAALFARENHGAEYGVAVGRTGNAYAIPTKNQQLQTLPLAKIAKYVQKFIWYAERTPHLEYEVTRIGCGLAGYTDSDIAPMFADAPTNCHLPDGWRSNV